MRKQILQNIIKENPNAVLVANKYKVLAGMAQRMYPELKEIPQAKLADMVYDIVNGDRDWRILTEGCDKENKKILEQEKMLSLGYSPNYHNDVRQLGLLK